MNVNLSQFDWNHVRAFLVTAEEGSLSAAARKLGLTQPTLGRQVAALEGTFDVLLFERIGKSLQLTQAGHELLGHVRVMGEAANRVSLVATGQSQSIEGRIRITASDIMSAYTLPPVLHKLRDMAPLLEIDVVAANDIRDLMRREADIAIRHVRPEQPELIARLVREETAHFYAAPSYLKRHGTPKTREDLISHDFIHFGNIDDMLGYLTPLGLPLSHKNFRIGSQSGLVGWELVRHGFGICAMADLTAQMFPEMVRLPIKMDPLVFPVWLATHRELHTSRRIRLVFDLLADHLSDP